MPLSPSKRIPLFFFVQRPPHGTSPANDSRLAASTDDGVSGGSFDAVPQTLSADSVAQDGDGAAPDAGIAAFDGDEVEGGDDLHVEEEG